MGHGVKLLTSRGIIAVCLSLCLIYLFVSDTTKHISEYIAVYSIVLNYLFGDGDKDK